MNGITRYLQIVKTDFWSMSMRYFRASNNNDQVDPDYAHYLKCKATVGRELAYIKHLQDYISGVSHDQG